jgi:hypothetical protein
VVPGYSGALHYSAPVHGSHADATSRDKRDEIVTKDKNFNSYSEPVNILKHHSKLYIISGLLGLEFDIDVFCCTTHNTLYQERVALEVAIHVIADSAQLRNVRTLSQQW